MSVFPLPFFPGGLVRLDALLTGPLLCAFDFDGTLAPIVSEPDAARMRPAVADRMRLLVRLAPVAVITGRSVGDMRERLSFAPDYVVGNHGLEGLPAGEPDQQANRRRCLGWEHALRAALDGLAAPDPGIRLENKVHTLSVHYRNARDPAEAEALLAGLIARACPDARMMRGKFVFNLLPPGAPDKGAALIRLMADSGAAGAIYVGDDVTDEDVFRLRQPDILTVRVGRADTTCADTFLAQQEDIAGLLDALIARLLKHARPPRRHDPKMNHE